MIKCFSPVRVQDLEKESVRLMKAFCLIVLSLTLFKNIIWTFETMTLTIIFLCSFYVIPWITMYFLRIFKAFPFKCNLFPVPLFAKSVVSLRFVCTSLQQFFNAAFVIISKSIGFKTRGCKIFMTHIYKNQKSFTVLDRFPHIMSLNLVLKGEQYHITSNFSFRRNCSALPAPWMTRKCHCILTSLPLLMSQTIGGRWQGKVMGMTLPCDALCCKLFAASAEHTNAKQWQLSNSEITVSLSCSTLCRFHQWCPSLTRLSPPSGNLICTSQLEI